MDGLAVSLAAAMATKRVTVGTAIANIYYRHPALAAASAANIHEISGGRLVLGLGTSHRVINEPRGIRIERPMATMREYVAALRKFAGQASLPPIYLAALRKGMARLAGEIADGVMFNMVPLSRFGEAVAAVREGERKRSDGKGGARIATFLGVSVSDDLAEARESARRMIAFYYRMEFYRNQAAEFGYGRQAERAGSAWERGDESGAVGAIDDAMVDELSIAGPPQRCRERLRQWEKAGVEMVILSARGRDGDQFSGFRAAVEGLAPGSHGQAAHS